MQTTNDILIAAPQEIVFQLAAEVERWPELLPHYRWVRVLERTDDRKLVEMAARRDWIPVKWTSIQRLHAADGRITFEHVAGATRGMAVEWTITPIEEGVHVNIWHDFRPPWPLVPDALVELIVGHFFVRSIAGKTLRHIKAHAESRVPSLRSQGSSLASQIPVTSFALDQKPRRETRHQRLETGGQRPETSDSRSETRDQA